MIRERRPIRLLPEDTARRIAAGEVIVRPASVVKELIENSLDADARRITVEVKSGGKDLIRVIDDGFGMTREDARLAVFRHATSKIASVEDLAKIQSYGFRGEALAAIAAVSRMTIETSTVEDGIGTKIEVVGGEIKEITDISRAPGTTVTVRMLFFNLPVRRAFLRSDNYELRLILEQLKSYALAFPEVAFYLTSNGRELVNMPSVNSLRERMLQLFPKQVVESLVELKVEHPSLSVFGYLTDTDQLKSFYEVQSVYFNRRPVRCQPVVRAVYDGYGPVVSGKHPDFVIFIETDPSRLDVNIHPTKQEVKFADERFLFDFLAEAVNKVLLTSRRQQLPAEQLCIDDNAVDNVKGVNDFWQLHNSYIFAQVASGYVIVDQHAAHERILYEEVKKSIQTHRAPQGLLFPITLELKPEELDALEQFSEYLKSMGLETKIFSGRTVVVEAIPVGSYLGKEELRALFSEMVQIRSEKVSAEDELAKLMACKGAVKAGQRLTYDEMHSLINRLFLCNDPYFCPHGRPTIIKISLDELERRFGRI